MKHSHRKEIEAIAKGLGFEVVSIEESGRHIRVTLAYEGKERFCFVSGSPSDHRNKHEMKLNLRRAFR